MFNTNKVSTLLQVAANIGLLLGLVLVGLQLSQTNSLARATHASLMFEQEANYYLARMGENPTEIVAKAIAHPEELTDAEALVMVNYAQWHISVLARSAQMQEFGVISDGWRVSIGHYGRSIGGVPVAREFVLQNFSEDPRPWVQEFVGVVRSVPERAGLRFLEQSRSAGQQYQTNSPE